MQHLREILRQKLALGRRHREVAAALQVSPSTVAGVVTDAVALGLDAAAVEALTDAELDGQLYPKPPPSCFRPEPDCAALHLELRRPGSSDVFVAKLDASGEHLWSEAFGGEGPQVATGVAVDADGRIALSGYFEESIQLGDERWEVESISDGFVAVLDPQGTPLWSRVAASDSVQRVVDVAFDPAGDVVIVGVTLSALDLGGGPIDPPPAPIQCFGARLAGGAGAHVWSLGFGCCLNEFVPLGARIAVDGSGRTTILASVGGPTDVGATPVTSSQDGDVLLFAVSPSGATAWVRTYDSGENDQGFELATDPEGNFVFTGHVGGPTDFGGGLVSSSSLSVQAFLVKVAP